MKKSTVYTSLTFCLNTVICAGILFAPAHLRTPTEPTKEKHLVFVEPLDSKSLKCLIENIYYEARGEKVEGWAAVATVTLNRVTSKSWPNTVCEVVYQPYQFSWTIGVNRKHLKITEPHKYTQIANYVLQINADGFVESPVKYADHYHTQKVQPSWNKNMQRENVVQNHIFFYSGA